mmetsp:Transcript_41965/g.136141  ORF Transcript_41965/g.136141 Transcript_41965/m.136141 type:complete len:126 (+) Transcript_41965:434-811(+)
MCRSSAAMCDARKACREGVPSWQYTISSSSTCSQEKRREEAPPRLASQPLPPPSAARVEQVGQAGLAGARYRLGDVRRLPILEAVVVPLLAARLANLDARGVRRSPQRVDEAWRVVGKNVETLDA